MLKDIVMVRNEINSFKDNYASVTQLQQIQMDIENLKFASLANHQNVNTGRRGAFLLESGPIGLPCSINTIEGMSLSAEQNHYVRDNKQTSCSNVLASAVSVAHMGSSAATSSSIVTSTPKQVTSYCTARVERNVSPPGAVKKQCNINNVKRPTMAEVIRSEGEWLHDNKSSEWKLVQRKRLKNRFVGKTGKAETELETKFRAAEMKIPLSISNVNKESTEKDICDYIRSKTYENITLEKIVIKTDKPYNAFKVFVNQNNLNLYLSDELWPNGIRFRRFIHFKKWHYANGEKTIRVINKQTDLNGQKKQ